MLKPQIPLTKQLAPLIIFLAIVILCTLVISNRRAAKKRAQEAAILPMEEQAAPYGAEPVQIQRKHGYGGRLR